METMNGEEERERKWYKEVQRPANSVQTVPMWLSGCSRWLKHALVNVLSFDLLDVTIHTYTPCLLLSLCTLEWVELIVSCLFTLLSVCESFVLSSFLFLTRVYSVWEVKYCNILYSRLLLTKRERNFCEISSSGNIFSSYNHHSIYFSFFPSAALFHSIFILFHLISILTEWFNSSSLSNLFVWSLFRLLAVCFSLSLTRCNWCNQ